MPLVPPDPFAGRYTGLRLLGRGGFGEVYRALDTAMEGQVALKLLNEDLAADPDVRRRFAQEATAARKLNGHPNITIVFDRGEFEGHPFIVMELLEGKSLAKLIRDGPALSVIERIGLIEQLCDGLHYAHQRNILHRDVKPGNLIVNEYHDGTHTALTLKILDFRIAKILSTEHTTTGQQMFSVNYVAPERILGETVDGRSDMFSVGAVAYELLSGQRTFDFSSKDPFTLLDEVKAKVVERPHRRLGELRPDLDPELCAIVDRALQKRPAERFADLAEMRRVLRRVRERLERSAPADRTRPWCCRPLFTRRCGWRVRRSSRMIPPGDPPPPSCPRDGHDGAGAATAQGSRSRRKGSRGRTAQKRAF